MWIESPLKKGAPTEKGHPLHMWFRHLFRVAHPLPLSSLPEFLETTLFFGLDKDSVRHGHLWTT